MSNSPATKRIAILISGRGSNMVALADAVRVGTIPNAEVAIVISDKRDAAGLESATERGIEILVIERGARTRQEHDREIVSALAGRTKYPRILPFPCGEGTVSYVALMRSSFLDTCCPRA